MPRTRIAALLLALAAGPAHGATWFVGGGGDDGNPGTSARQPFRTLQRAADRAVPGDIVDVLDGTYTPACAGCKVLTVTRPGEPGAWITYRAAPGSHPVIDFAAGWAGISVEASYIEIRGFDVAGGARAITLDTARQRAGNLRDHTVNANGIAVGMRDHLVHHVRVVGNTVHDAPGGGIAVKFADYVAIIGNECFGNAFWSPYGGSGISIWDPRDSDQKTGYKLLVIGNRSYGNREYLPSVRLGKITDGNGIIIDDTKNTQSNKVPYGGRTYVGGNLVYANGGSGIHAFKSEHVDIVFNTAYRNNMEPSLEAGQIFAAFSDDVRIADNIMVGDRLEPSRRERGGGSAVFERNVVQSGQELRGDGNIAADPQFAAPEAGNFRLRPGSPARGGADPALATIRDADGGVHALPIAGNRGAPE